MDIASIEKFLVTNKEKFNVFNIHFKDRSPVTGIFVSAKDHSELKAKNFWRFVNLKNLQQWKATKDINLSRLFNGASFTRLSGAVE